MELEPNGISPEAAMKLNAAFTKAKALYQAVGRAALSGNNEYAAELLREYEDACLDIRLALREAGFPVINRCEVKYPKGSGM